MRFTVLVLGLALIVSPAAAQPPPAPNPEMARIFSEDQADRNGEPGTIDWKAVGPRDEQRRAATRKLLADGLLKTAEDFHAAAFVFQHGHQENDFLLAHTLAMAAVERGKKESLWIATATLDRYLMQLGRPQIYGTQYSRPHTTRIWTQEPYNRELLSDALRSELGVKTLAEQAETLAGLQAAAPPAQKAP